MCLSFAKHMPELLHQELAEKKSVMKSVPKWDFQN
jgi:hypothetical protein